MEVPTIEFGRHWPRFLRALVGGPFRQALITVTWLGMKGGPICLQLRSERPVVNHYKWPYMGL